MTIDAPMVARTFETILSVVEAVRVRALVEAIKFVIVDSRVESLKSKEATCAVVDATASVVEAIAKVVEARP